MNKPRILIVMSCYFPVIGGAENQAKMLAENLVSRGWSVSVLTKLRNPEMREYETINGVSVYRVRDGVPGIIRNLVIKHKVYDIVLFAGQLSNVSRLKIFSQVLIGSFLKLVYKKKVFLWPTSGADRYKLLFGPLISRKLLKFFDGIFCKSLEQKDFFTSIVGDTIEIYEPPWSMIDIEEYSIPTPEEKSEIRSMLNIPLNKRVLLFTGRLFEGKGIDLLLDAYDKLQLKYSDVHLLVVGAVSENNPENNKYVKQIRADNYYGGTCTLVLNQVNVSVYFKAADIFVFPTYSEGCPVVQLEAMATGLICVASDLEPIKEKIIDGVTGYTFVSGNSCDLQEKLELALRRVGNKDFALKIREAVYEKYSIAHVIARWETHITDYWLRTNYGVVIHTPWAYPRIGGIQKISFETAKGLTSQGFKVTIVTRIHDKSLSVRETVDGIRIVRLSYVPYLMHVQLVFFLIKEWNNFRHLSIWGAYGDFITFPTMLLATVVKLLGKKVSIRLSNQLMENKTYAEKVII